MFMYCIQTAKDIVKLLSQVSFASLVFNGERQCPVLYIRQMNRVNSRNDLVMMTALKISSWLLLLLPNSKGNTFSGSAKYSGWVGKILIFD